MMEHLTGERKFASGYDPIGNTNVKDYLDIKAAVKIHCSPWDSHRYGDSELACHI